MPAKALVSAVILTMALAMAGAMGQIVVHDIIPTFFSSSQMEHRGSKSMQEMEQTAADAADDRRGDLFAEELTEMETDKPSFLHSEQFVWILKWTHIHFFGMNMIFIIMGAITLFLDLGIRTRSWLVVLPFVGVFIDIAAMWLKVYISPVFFWLHIPGEVFSGWFLVSSPSGPCWKCGGCEIISQNRLIRFINAKNIHT